MKKISLVATWLGWLLAVGALGLAAVSGWLWLCAPGDARPALVVESTERQFGSLPVGASQIVFRITNQSEAPGQIIGLDEG